MNPVAVAVVAGGIVVAGKVAMDKAPTVENAVGIAGIALGLAALEQVNEKLSNAFAALILLSVAIVYIPRIVQSVGFSRK